MAAVVNGLESYPVELWVRSPCVAICELNADDICIGCGRSRAEITDWARLDADGKRAVNVRAEQRRQELNTTAATRRPGKG
jgi:uncharacterized protein